MNRLALCVAATASATALAAGPAATADPSPGKHAESGRHHAAPKVASEPTRLARAILNTKGITYAKAHVGGTDKASLPRQNLVDVSNEHRAKTSPWGHKKGARVALDKRMLNGILKLNTKYHYKIEISELVGGRHSRTSKHYAGRAVDVAWINGRHVGKRADHRGLMKACRSLGATLVLGPGDKDHDTHVHCQW
ncbi:hypothetical protein ACFY8C_39775 [Streptomyces flavochromogenes]|uniref:Uncharacterized protein n=1 Tax=Streptomyces flavochromogenes TaxID=68199 RepID=A0ABW6Y3Q8_9ACTN|nr:hypothetical protein [Streptomyces flavochromogenes]